MIDLNFEPRHFFALSVSILVVGLLDLGLVESFFVGAGFMLWADLLFHIGIYAGNRWGHHRTTSTARDYPEPPSPIELPDEFEMREIAVYGGRVYAEAEDGGVEVVHEVEESPSVEDVKEAYAAGEIADREMERQMAEAVDAPIEEPEREPELVTELQG